MTPARTVEVVPPQDVPSSTRVFERRSEAGTAVKRSPHSLMQELLNRSPAHQWGIIANGLQLMAYEGGQHLVGLGAQVSDTALTAKLTSTNRNPKIKTLYLEYLGAWRQLGGGRFMSFASVWLPNQNGSWGALEWQDQDPATAPKYRALVQAAGW